MTSQTFELDLIPQGVAPVIHVSQYDKGQTWFIKVLENGVSFEIPENCAVTVQGTKPDNTAFQYACTYSGNIVAATVTQQMTAVVGDVTTEIRISQDDSAQIVGSLNFTTRVEEGGISDDTIISETDISMIEQAIELAERVPEIIQECQQYVDASEDNAEYSEKFATGAINGSPVPYTDPAYQNNAKYFKEQADTDAQNAATSATNAATSEDNAEAWATGKIDGTDVPSTADQYHNNAKYYSDEANTSATNAATSEGNASTSETNAGTSATNAAASATLAESYAKGGTNTRTGEDTDNAKYYMEQAQAAASGAGAADFIGATASQDGDHGLVPKPLIADKDKFLKGDGTWATPSGGGGSSTLNGLSDVNLTSPTDGQILKYDASSQKWINIGIDSTPTQNSGNPVTSGGVYNALPTDMTGATGSANGTHGLVPPPLIADKDKFLKGDGTWATPSGGSSTASGVSYTNTTSGLTATNVQDAIDELDSTIDSQATAIAKCELLTVSVASFSSLPQTVNDANIESDMVCVHSELGTPSAQTGDWTVTTANGSVTVSGTISGSTTLTMYLMKAR